MTFLENRPHGKKMGIVITTILLIITLAETIVRGMCPDYLFASTDVGETLAIAILAAAILLFTIKKKDRLSYICYGGLIAWYALEKALAIPGLFASLFDNISNLEILATISKGAGPAAIAMGVIDILVAICVIAIGALLVEYMNDGTIYNKAFDVLCTITALLLLVSLVASVHGMIVGKTVELVLIVLNDLYNIAMVFMLMFFAYDSAKMQLKKANLSK